MQETHLDINQVLQLLVEGRYPNIYVSFRVAEITDEKAKHIKNKGLDDKFYKHG